MTKNNKVVTAKVIEAPDSCKNITKRGGYCKLLYREKIFVIKAGKKFCHLVSNREYVKMLTNEENDELIFPNKYKPIDFLFSLILFLLGVYTIVKGYKKNR